MVSPEITLTSIAGSTLTTTPSSTGPQVTFTYTTLPSDNSEFGKKILALSHPSFPFVEQKEIEVYYAFGAKNWPGAEPFGGAPDIKFDPNNPYNQYRWEKTNWYVYYSQVSEAERGCGYNYLGSVTEREPPYPTFVGNLQNPRHNHAQGVNGEAILYGIDCFAWASRHETKHSVDFNAWWPSGWEHGEDTNDVDEDMLRDADERTWPASGGGDYDPTKKCTYQLYWPDTQQWQDAEDNEWECIHTQEEWEVGSQVGNDWAYPGSRWY